MRMSRPNVAHGWWWLAFGACCLALGIVMSWISVVVLRLEAQTQHQQFMQLALWRMDGWLSPLLRAEANRPYFVYLPFVPHERAYTKILNEIEPGEVYTPSPLLTFQSDYFPLHFQMSADGQISSPQVPAGNWRDLAESQYALADAIGRKEPLLTRVTALLAPTNMEACVSATETTLANLVDTQTLTLTPPNPVLTDQQLPAQQVWSQQSASKADLQQRMNANYRQQELVVSTQTRDMKDGASQQNVDVGLMVPLWFASNVAERDSTRELVFVRRVSIGPNVIFQGFLADWPALRGALLQQIGDVFPKCSLLPVVDPRPADAESGRLLGSLPVLLEAPTPSLASGSWFTPSRVALALTWCAVIGGLVATAITLRASIHYGQKRSRFASAVTHELRTPLTTFRMYSEMLADGMVPDEAQRTVYLNTLKNESSRLASLVENVLAYARLEDGRSQPLAKSTTVQDLLDGMKPILQRRAASAGITLRIENRSADAPVIVDINAILQIVFNVIDNSCKYAAPATHNAPDLNNIDISCDVRDRQLRILMRDYGPGIAPQHARVVFKPFERGSHKPGDTTPGVGLGLALARGLARHLGGDLILLASEKADELFMPKGKNHPRGAAFLLVLPLALETRSE